MKAKILGMELEIHKRGNRPTWMKLSGKYIYKQVKL